MPIFTQLLPKTMCDASNKQKMSHCSRLIIHNKKWWKCQQKPLSPIL